MNSSSLDYLRSVEVSWLKQKKKEMDLEKKKNISKRSSIPVIWRWNLLDTKALTVIDLMSETTSLPKRTSILLN